MHTDRKSRSGLIKMPLFASLVLACGLFTGNSQAQWVVTDPTVLAQDWGKFVKEFAQWQKELDNWQKQYSEALTKLNGIMGNPANMMASYRMDMNPVPENHGEVENCPLPGRPGEGFSLSTLFSAFSLNPDGDIVKQQWQLCIMANRLRNKKYNEMVAMVKEAKDRSKKIDDLVRSAKSDKTEGAWRSSMLSGQTIMAATLVDMQFAEARLKAYDEMIAKVERDSDGLAKKAMNGKQSLLGTVVSTATLKAALEGIK